MYDSFIKAIQEKRIVTITFDSNEKGPISRKCIPFDFGPSRKFHDNSDRYHFYDLDSPEGKHNLSILEAQLINLVITEDTFEPGDYVRWMPNWFVQRDWGDYS